VEKEGVVLASGRFTGTGIELKATKKNGGAGGTRWFDAHWLLEGASDFILPRQIPATAIAAFLYL
jgi:hypothetical protein